MLGEVNNSEVVWVASNPDFFLHTQSCNKYKAFPIKGITVVVGVVVIRLSTVVIEPALLIYFFVAHVTKISSLFVE